MGKADSLYSNHMRSLNMGPVWAAVNEHCEV